jgi:hypothetical protein
VQIATSFAPSRNNAADGWVRFVDFPASAKAAGMISPPPRTQPTAMSRHYGTSWVRFAHFSKEYASDLAANTAELGALLNNPAVMNNR